MRFDLMFLIFGIVVVYAAFAVHESSIEYRQDHSYEWTENLSDYYNIKAENEALSDSELRDKIISELGTDLKIRNMTIIEKKVSIYETYTEKELIFKDDLVGSFMVLVLLPKYTDKKSAIIGAHGHHNDSYTFRDINIGKELVNAGYIVVMPSYRAMSEHDSEVSLYLAGQGHTLMGVHVYETLLVIDYLKSMGIDSIGAAGHSGGSTILTLASAVSDDIKARVVDHPNDYIDTHYHCETIPALHPYYRQINRDGSFGVPQIFVNYNLKEDADQIIDFFDQQLD